MRKSWALSNHYRDSGADVIDIGCIPGESWRDIGRVVAMLRAEGLRVSVDSFDRDEVTTAVEAGAELVLSVNQSNLDWAVDLPVEWIAIPDNPASPEQLIPITERLSQAGRRFRVDPIIEPIGFGFAASLARYFEVRRERADWAMMMGVGNITEMSEVDSAGLNFLLAAVCQELAIGSVLTTEVANWARSSVKEFDLARRLVKQALDETAAGEENRFTAAGGSRRQTSAAGGRLPRGDEPAAEGSELPDLCRTRPDPRHEP